MFRPLAIFALFLTALAAHAATLQQLSLEDMAASSSAIVRARVTGSSARLHGSTIYTHYRLEVAETWKGRAVTEVMIPGGLVGRSRQTFPGVPELTAGSEYLLFLWTSPTGITHLIGLTQGLFSVTADADGAPLASRPEIGELMLDADGRKVTDRPIRMRLGEMKAQVAARASGGSAR